MPQFKVKRRAYGPKSPGARHRMLEAGEIIEADKLPSDAYEPVNDGEAATVASPAVVEEAKGRAKRAANARKDEDV